MTASSLARKMIWRGRHRSRSDQAAYLAGYREPGEAAGQLPGRHDEDRHEHDQAFLIVAEIAPQHQSRRSR